MKIKYHHKYWLSTEGYYFMYRFDKYDSMVTRATLYEEKTGNVIDDCRVSAGHGMKEKSHHDVINYFEARIYLRETNN